MVDRYLTVARPGVYESEIKRSRFRCALAPAGSQEAAEEFVRAVRKEHPGATHNCFAYVIGPDGRLHRASDDGEPGGTAGTPMLQVLLGREVRDTVAVVTRYYGGVQLGAGGLARAYGGAVSAALDATGTVERRLLALLTVTADHQRAGRLENELRAAATRCARSSTAPPSPSTSASPNPTSPPSAPGWPTPLPAPPPAPPRAAPTWTSADRRGEGGRGEASARRDPGRSGCAVRGRE